MGRSSAGLEEQQAALRAEEEKLTAATQRLEARVEDFRTRKEMLKAEYTRAEAEARIGEAVSGVGDVLGDVGAAVRRAQDRTAQLQARSAALDELTSGALEDATVPAGPDEVQVGLERISTDQDVEQELKRLKAQFPAAPASRTQEETGTGRAEPGWGAVAVTAYRRRG
ncbi:PspA/IM30 family protein [Kitasatospora sp. NPDC001159]